MQCWKIITEGCPDHAFWNIFKWQLYPKHLPRALYVALSSLGMFWRRSPRHFQRRSKLFFWDFDRKLWQVEQLQSTESEKLKIRKVESGKVESRDSEVESGQREWLKFCKAYKQAAEVPCRRFAGRAQRGSRSYSAFLTNRRSGGEAAAEAESGRH